MMHGAAQSTEKSARTCLTVCAFTVTLFPPQMRGVTPEVKPSMLAAVAYTPHSVPRRNVVYLAMSLRVPEPTART